MARGNLGRSSFNVGLAQIYKPRSGRCNLGLWRRNLGHVDLISAYLMQSRLKQFTAAIRGGVLKRWKEIDIVRGLVSATSTERTRLSGTALDLVAPASRIGSYWDSAVPFYAPTIIKLLGRACKIYVTRATITLTSLIKGTKSLVFIPYLIDGISEKSVTIRIGCADALLCCLSNTVNVAESSESRKQRSKDGLNKQAFKRHRKRDYDRWKRSRPETQPSL
ncbi:uncharacterized protein VP01_2889g2 [Puccinia sorghi]|uniref:Uncharacterized protein n=1 Tax=Puccinia sorghi TaxID=27349 RepID=A0A0L6V1L1_9BASI|nr:uncharacterized protein VP01_2889g2 [Puccinia sorghi]